MAIVLEQQGLSPVQAGLKRSFDFFVAFLGLTVTGWLIALAWLAASLDTLSNGFFIQKRVGRNAKIFRMVEIKTMHPVASFDTTVTRRGIT